MEKELREAVEEGKRYIGSYYLEEHPELMDNYRKVMKTLIDLAQSYLDLKGFPDEKEIVSKLKRCSCEVGRDGYEIYLREKEVIEIINEALHLCKLAYLKEKGVLQADEVTLAFFRKYLEMPEGNLETMCQEIIRLKKDKVEVMSEEEIERVLENPPEVDSDIPNVKVKEWIVIKPKNLAHVLSNKISKPKKIGREEIAKIKKLIEILKNSTVGKAAIHVWAPNGIEPFLQVDEIIYNRFYDLAGAILKLLEKEE